MLMSHSLPLGALLVLCLLWPSAVNFADARCGYPELPIGTQLASLHFENFGYFEEGYKVKVICENGLIGHEQPSAAVQATNHSDAIELEHFMMVDSVDWIECRNSRWNSSELQCLHKVNLDTRNVQVKWKHVEAVRSLDAFLDNNALSCLDIDLDSSNLEKHETVLFSIRLDGDQARIPRVVLMMKSAQVDTGHTNITLLEDLIMDMNTIANLSDTEGDVEVEEAKRFLDFVYETEFSTVNYSGPVKMLLIGEDEVSDRRHKVLRTAQHEARVSVSLGSSFDPTLLSRDCYFNEDAAITVDRNISTELLIFDCQSPAEGKPDKADLIWIRLEIAKLNDRNGTTEANATGEPKSSRSMLQMCGLEAFAITESTTCGKPYVPVYGVVTKIKVADGASTAQYGCMSGYKAINLTAEQQNQLATLEPVESDKLLPMERVCDQATKKWQPATEDIFCEPINSCRHPPPMSDARKFYYEYSKLDNLKRAIGGRSMATLRCLMVTDFVVPFTMYSCDKSGHWVKGVKNSSNVEPTCRSSLLGRNSRRGKPSHYHHHYYHYYQNEKPQNRTAVIIFGRQINDNKYLIYYGAAGLVVLFGGSFIILFHVRRMAKKISRQMRERSYMAAEKGVADHFLPVSAGMDGNMPPYYNNNENFYEAGTMFSNDLPPPATPISMPSSGLEKGEFKDKNNLSANFDSIKF